MLIVPKKYGEVETRIMNPDSSSGVHVTVSVEAERHMISQNVRFKRKKRKEHQK